jgi:UDPglucose 6-dehydrogenase
VHDPVAMDRFRREHADLDVTCCKSASDVARDADALVLVTEWPEYRELDWESLLPSMRTAIVPMDATRSTGRALRAPGYRYLVLA